MLLGFGFGFPGSAAAGPFPPPPPGCCCGTVAAAAAAAGLRAPPLGLVPLDDHVDGDSADAEAAELLGDGRVCTCSPVAGLNAGLNPPRCRALALASPTPPVGVAAAPLPLPPALLPPVEKETVRRTVPRLSPGVVGAGETAKDWLRELGSGEICKWLLACRRLAPKGDPPMPLPWLARATVKNSPKSMEPLPSVSTAVVRRVQTRGKARGCQD